MTTEIPENDLDITINSIYDSISDIIQKKNKLEYELNENELKEAEELSKKYSPYLLAMMYLYSNKAKDNSPSFLSKTIGFNCVKCNTRLSLYKNPFKYRFCPNCGVRVNFNVKGD